MKIDKEEPKAWAVWGKGFSAPFLYCHLEDGSGLLIQWMHIDQITLSQDCTLICIHYTSCRVHIEGQALQSLFVDMQLAATQYVRAGTRQNSEKGMIKRVVKVDIEPEAPER